MLQSLASRLRKEVFTNLYGNIIKQSKIFTLNFSTEFIDSLALLMEEFTLGPEEFIYK